jgi:predicted DNA-binding transcriptional regulator AlpA
MAKSKRLLRRPGVEAKVRLKQSAIYELIKRGQFPKAIKNRTTPAWKRRAPGLSLLGERQIQ